VKRDGSEKSEWDRYKIENNAFLYLRWYPKNGFGARKFINKRKTKIAAFNGD
jgi:hypothetical protein